MTTNDYGEPWSHTPEIDWGFIQNCHGETVARATTGLYSDEAVLNEHRKNRTDPTQTTVERIVACVNALAGKDPSAVAAGEEACERMVRNRWCHDLSNKNKPNCTCNYCQIKDALAAFEGRGAE